MTPTQLTTNNYQLTPRSGPASLRPQAENRESGPEKTRQSARACNLVQSCAMAEENPQLNEVRREQNEVPRKGNKIRLAIASAKGASIPDSAQANGVKRSTAYNWPQNPRARNETYPPSLRRLFLRKRLVRVSQILRRTASGPASQFSPGEMVATSDLCRETQNRTRSASPAEKLGEVGNQAFQWTPF